MSKHITIKIPTVPEYVTEAISRFKIKQKKDIYWMLSEIDARSYSEDYFERLAQYVFEENNLDTFVLAWMAKKETV